MYDLLTLIILNNLYTFLLSVILVICIGDFRAEVRLDVTESIMHSVGHVDFC
jgi:hypothetical protein